MRPASRARKASAAVRRVLCVVIDLLHKVQATKDLAGQRAAASTSYFTIASS
jgi:hypothetical protein